MLIIITIVKEDISINQLTASIVFTFCGRTTVLYKSKTRSLTVTNSTVEVDFIVAFTDGKI